MTCRRKQHEIDFWDGADKSGDCWLWQGSKVGNGYGKVGWKGKTARAHRVAWELANGPIPDGAFVCHRCDNPACIRPDHLFLGDSLVNVRDMIGKDRQASGHIPSESRPRGDDHYSRQEPERLARGEEHGNAKLTKEQVKEIRRRYAETDITLKELAEEFGMAKSPVHMIVQRKTWKHVD